IIALTSTVTYVSYSMGILDNYNQSVLAKNQQLSDVNKEMFQVSSITVPNNKLNITVTNIGNIPINFTKIWIQNTTATDWVRSYTTAGSFVTAGGTLKNIGQNIPVYINSANSYNVKLVTSRGNTQQFTVNSIISTKLNIQLYAFPSTVLSGFKSQIVLVVTNNSTGTLANLTPAVSVSPTTGTPTCTLGVASPSKVDTLLPGGTAVLSWPVTVSGSNNDVCTATVQLPNGQTLQIPMTVTVVSLSSTTYSQSSEVVTLDYTSFRWTKNGQWNSDWQFNNGYVAFSMTLTNNNQTAGNYKLWLSQNTMLCLYLVPPTNNNVATTFYAVKSVNANFPDGSTGLTSYSPDYFQGIPNQGGSSTVYFGATGKGNHTPVFLGAGTYMGFLVVYGKFTVNSGDNTGGNYAQTLPFIAVISN